MRRQAVAIHSSLLESRNFDGNEGMREAVQRVQDLEKQLLGTIDIFCLWKGDVGKEKGKTSRFPVDFGTESNEVCNLVKDWSFFFLDRFHSRNCLLYLEKREWTPFIARNESEG